MLDVARGGGHTAAFFAARGAEVMAARGLAVATREFPAEAMPFGDGEFDLVTCRVAAHQCSDPEGFVRESARMRRPGGFGLLVDGSLPDGHPEAEEWIQRVEKWRDPSHGRFGSVGTWAGRCRAAGLAVVRVELQRIKQPDLQ